MITLLRAVGHVLDKVDGRTSPELRELIDEMYQRLKDHEPHSAIFWRFIEEERNNVLKLYRFSVRGNLTIGVPPGSIGFVTDPLGTRYLPESSFEILPLGDGPFKGRLPVTVVQQAIEFWRNHLDEIDKSLSGR